MQKTSSCTGYWAAQYLQSYIQSNPTPTYLEAYLTIWNGPYSKVSTELKSQSAVLCKVSFIQSIFKGTLVTRMTTVGYWNDYVTENYMFNCPNSILSPLNSNKVVGNTVSVCVGRALAAISPPGLHCCRTRGFCFPTYFCQCQPLGVERSPTDASLGLPKPP